jgi:hypothetical protein
MEVAKTSNAQKTGIPPARRAESVFTSLCETDNQRAKYVIVNKNLPGLVNPATRCSYAAIAYWGSM